MLFIEILYMILSIKMYKVDLLRRGLMRQIHVHHIWKLLMLYLIC